MGVPGFLKRLPAGGQESKGGYVSADYQRFEKGEEEEKRLGGLFGRLCRFSGRILNVRAPDRMRGKLEKSLIILDLNISPDQVFSLSALVLFASLLLAVPAAAFMTLEMQLALLALPFLLFYYVMTYPSVMADITKI